VASTTIPSFQAALEELLLAQTVFVAGLPLTDGIPSPGTFDRRDWVALLDVEFEQNTAALNQTTRPRDEFYSQTVLISVVAAKREDAQSVASDRAWEIFAAIEAAVRANPTLSPYYTGDGYIIAATLTKNGRLRKAVTDDSRESSIEFTIDVRARI